MTETLVNASTPVDGVRVLALNRPSKRHALSQELIGLLLEHLTAASSDTSVRASVITGSSTFCCGEYQMHPSIWVSFYPLVEQGISDRFLIRR